MQVRFCQKPQISFFIYKNKYSADDHKYKYDNFCERFYVQLGTDFVHCSRASLQIGLGKKDLQLLVQDYCIHEIGLGGLFHKMCCSMKSYSMGPSCHLKIKKLQSLTNHSDLKKTQRITKMHIFMYNHFSSSAVVMINFWLKIFDY